MWLLFFFNLAFLSLLKIQLALAKKYVPCICSPWDSAFFLEIISASASWRADCSYGRILKWSDHYLTWNEKLASKAWLNRKCPCLLKSHLLWASSLSKASCVSIPRTSPNNHHYQNHKKPLLFRVHFGPKTVRIFLYNIANLHSPARKALWPWILKSKRWTSTEHWSPVLDHCVLV